MDNLDSERNTGSEMRDALIQNIKLYAKMDSLILKYDGDFGAMLKGLKNEAFESEAQRLTITAKVRKMHRAGYIMENAEKIVERDREREGRQRHAFRDRVLDLATVLILFLLKLVETLRGG